MSGMFLATTVTLRVTGLPGTAKMPPPVAALLRVIWLNLMVSAPPGAGPVLVMVASMIPPPCPEAVLRLIWLKVMVITLWLRIRWGVALCVRLVL